MLNSTYNGYPVHLIQNLSEFDFIKQNLNEKVNVGCDTETTGLDYIKDEVVGVCIACGNGYDKNNYHGFYIPIRHFNYKDNLPVKETIELVQFIVDNYKTVWWNRNYDATMLEKDGFVMPFIGKTHDAQCMAHLVMGESFPALKDFANRLLKFDVIEFSENNAKDHNFGSTDPTITFKYACFSDDTKFLTRTGFKYFDEIQEGEEIAQWIPGLDELEFVKPLKRFDYKSDKLIEFGSACLSCCVTPNHRVFGRNNIRRPFGVRTAEKWFNKSLMLKTGTFGYSGVSIGPQVFKESVVTKNSSNRIELNSIDFMNICGFLLADGCVSKNNSSWHIRLAQANIDKKEKQIEWLDNLQNRVNIFHVTIRSREGQSPMKEWSLTHKNFGGFLRENFYHEDGSKYIPDWVYSASRDERLALLEGFKMGDGSVRSDREVFHLDICWNKELAEQLLDLCVSVGWTCKMSVYQECNTTFSPDKPVTKYRIHIVPNLEWRSVNKESWSIKEGGRVVCFQVPSSYLIVQRNYTNYISGNCQDPLVTTLTARKIWTDYPYIHKIYPIDNKFAESIRRLSMDAPIYLDRELLEKLYNENAAELAKVKQEIFSTVGYQFKLNSNRDKADVLSRYVTLTQKTAKGAFAVSDEVLASIDHPVARLLQKYAELEKLRGTYLEKMRGFSQPFYVNYQHCNVSCLTEDNIVRTYEQGLLSIKDVEVGMHVLSENGFYPVESKAVFKDEVVKVTLRNGAFIEGNKKHPVLSYDGSWIKLGDLKEGQRVMMCRPFVESKSKVILPEVKWNKTCRTKVFEFSRVLDPDFASILGFLDGDGSLVKDGVKLCFSEFEPEVEDFYINLFAKRLNINIPKRCVGKDHSVQYKFCSTSLSRWFKDLGVKPHGEELGIDVSKWGTEEQMAYVAALFDTDGSLSTQVKSGRFNLVLAMTSKGVIDNVAKILRFHGIDVHLSEVRQGRKSPLYRLRVRSFKKFRIFIERIGKYMHCSHKLDRLNSLEFNYESHYNRWVGKEDSSEVISIESKGIKQVYDITVGTDHTFIANGIVTHNTGRMSSGTSKGNSYFAPINIQNIPKVEIYKYLHKGGILGYYLDYNKENAIAKMKCKGGMRDLFVAPEGYVWISGDYSAEEVRVLAIMSNEQVLIEPILHGEDIHKFVATKMFGHYDPAHRTIAKTITFAANYGGSGYTIAKRLGISQQEGEALLDRYNKTLVNATRWKQEMIKEARRKGIVFTYFGRPRCVWQYYNSSDRSKHGFADRTAINSPIQGFGGDLIRIDHIKLWQKFLDDKEFAENVKYACTVHDEINLFVKPHYLKKAMDTLNSIMNFQPSAFPIPISITPSVGFGWGDQIEASVNDNNQISIPEYDNVPVEELVAKFKAENPDLYD